MTMTRSKCDADCCFGATGSRCSKITCELCTKIYHIKCANVTNSLAKTIRDGPGVCWLCVKCRVPSNRNTTSNETINLILQRTTSSLRLIGGLMDTMQIFCRMYSQSTAKPTDRSRFSGRSDDHANLSANDGTPFLDRLDDLQLNMTSLFESMLEDNNKRPRTSSASRPSLSQPDKVQIVDVPIPSPSASNTIVPVVSDTVNRNTAPGQPCADTASTAMNSHVHPNGDIDPADSPMDFTDSATMPSASAELNSITPQHAASSSANIQATSSSNVNVPLPLAASITTNVHTAPPPLQATTTSLAQSQPLQTTTSSSHKNVPLPPPYAASITAYAHTAPLPQQATATRLAQSQPLPTTTATQASSIPATTTYNIHATAPSNVQAIAVDSPATPSYVTSAIPSGLPVPAQQNIRQANLEIISNVPYSSAIPFVNGYTLSQRAVQSTTNRTQNFNSGSHSRSNTTLLVASPAPSAANQASNGKWFYLTRFKPNESEENIISYIQGQTNCNRNAIHCTRLVSANLNRPLSFVSFKISVPVDLEHAITSSNFWPSGVTIAPFLERDPPQNLPRFEIQRAQRRPNASRPPLSRIQDIRYSPQILSPRPFIISGTARQPLPRSPMVRSAIPIHHQSSQQRQTTLV